MNFRALALLGLLLGAGALAVSPVNAADPGACAALWGALRAPGEVAQDDAGSGGDAGDSAAYATPLPVSSHSYSWGFVEPGLARDFADLEDWFSLSLLGLGEYAMAEVNATFLRSDLLPYSPLEADAIRFEITAFPPAGDPILGEPNGNGGTRVHFTNRAAGEWLFRVRLPHLAGESVACAAVYPNPVVEDPTPTAPATNYGVYFGCHPHCTESIE